MRVNTRALLSATAIMLVLVIPSAAWAQHKHTQRTEEGRHGGHEVGDVEDDEIAASHADDGSHEDYV